MLSRIKYLKVFLKDPYKKSSFKILKETIAFTWIKKGLPIDYFRKFLYRTDVKNYKDYLSLKEYYSIIESPKMVFPEVSALLHNKLSFKLIAEKHELPVATMLAYNLKNQFTSNKKSTTIHNEADLYKVVEDLFAKNQIDKIFVKPMCGIGGAGCFIIGSDTIKNSIASKCTDITTNSYLFEAYIEQHQAIRAIYPDAINTLRIVHYIDKSNTVHILSSLMRFGVGKAITDNTSSGGFSIAINNATGKLKGPGRQDVTKGGAVYYKHPDTQYVLEGFSVPYYQEACALVQDTAPYFPNRIVGWDMAITATGPVIIEANHNPCLHLSDIAYGGFLKHPLIKEILNEIHNK